MRQIPRLLVSVPLLALTGTLLVAGPAAARERPELRELTYTCDHRICLVVVVADADSDGDGVTDVDERISGTDPHDARDHPSARELVDVLIAGKLESFGRHLTELVVFPQNSPDLSSLSTALGSMPLPGKAWLQESGPAQQLERLLGNGFSEIDSIMGYALGGRENGLPAGATSGWAAYRTQISAGGKGGYTWTFSDPDLGLNAGKTGGTTTSAPVTGWTESWGSGFSSSTTTTFADGSTNVDEYTGTEDHRPGENVHTSQTHVQKSSDGHGTTTTTVFQTDTATNPKTGESTSTTVVSGTETKDGKPTQNTVITVRTEVKNGTSTSTTTIDKTDANGTTTTTTSPPTTTSCPNNACATKYEDPDYVDIGRVTAADWGRVIARLESVRTPGPDEGRVQVDALPVITGTDPYALYAGDGVVVLSMSSSPTFNKARPEYDPHLPNMADRAGLNGPIPTNDGAGYWGDPRP